MNIYGKCVQIHMSFWLKVLSATQTVTSGKKLTKLNIFETMKFSTFNLIYFKTNFCGHCTNKYSHDAL